MNENIKRNHKDIEWKQLFFEIPVFFTHPVCIILSTGVRVGGKLRCSGELHRAGCEAAAGGHQRHSGAGPGQCQHGQW